MVRGNKVQTAEGLVQSVIYGIAVGIGVAIGWVIAHKLGLH